MPRRWTTCLILLLASLMTAFVSTRARAEAPLFAAAIDCSGSTAQGDAPSDPEGYSISGAGLLAEAVAPGRLLLLRFCSTNDGSVYVHGPYDLSRDDQRAAVRDLIQNLQRDRSNRNGGTPLQAVVERANREFEQIGAPAGSALTIFTDGQPDPDPDGQYAVVTTLAQGWRQRGWKIGTIGLGPSDSPWLGRLSRVAAASGGPSMTATRASELLTLFVRQWAELVGEPSPRETLSPLPGSGVASSEFSLDPTVRSALVVAARPSSDTRVTLYGPDGAAITRTDRRIAAYADSDPHFVFIRLKSPDPLGSGTWRVSFAGPPGSDVGVAVAYQGRFAAKLVAPAPGTSAPVGQPFPVSVLLQDGVQPLARGDAHVHVQLIPPSGNIKRLPLRDSGVRAEGDQYAADGVYSAMAELSEEGEYRYQIIGQIDGVELPPAEGSFRGTVFPTLLALQDDARLAPVPAGTPIETKVARLVAGEGNANPADVSEVLIQVLNAHGQPVLVQTLTPAEAFDNGLLRIRLTPRRADLREPAGTLNGGGTFVTSYTVRAGLKGVFRGEAYDTPAALDVRVEAAVELKETWGHRASRAFSWLWDRFREYQHWIEYAVAGAVIIWFAVWLFRRGRRRPRLAGTLTGDGGTVISLSPLNAKVSPHRRPGIVQAVWVEDVPPLHGVHVAATRDGQGERYWVRFRIPMDQGQLSLSGAPVRPTVSYRDDLVPLAVVMGGFVLAGVGMILGLFLPLTVPLCATILFVVGTVAVARFVSPPMERLGWHQLVPNARLTIVNRLQDGNQQVAVYDYLAPTQGSAPFSAAAPGTNGTQPAGTPPAASGGTAPPPPFAPPNGRNAPAPPPVWGYGGNGFTNGNGRSNGGRPPAAPVRGRTPNGYGPSRPVSNGARPVPGSRPSSARPATSPRPQPTRSAAPPGRASGGAARPIPRPSRPAAPGQRPTPIRPARPRPGGNGRTPGR